MNNNEKNQNISEEELIELWNSYFFEKNDKQISNQIESIMKSINQNKLSSAYTFSKQLTKAIEKKMIENKETVKVVINDGYGGFALSPKAMTMFAKLKGVNESELNIYSGSFSRHDEDLIKVVEELKEEVNAICSTLKIVEIPKGIQYSIYDNDGWETVLY